MGANVLLYCRCYSGDAVSKKAPSFDTVAHEFRLFGFQSVPEFKRFYEKLGTGVNGARRNIKVIVRLMQRDADIRCHYCKNTMIFDLKVIRPMRRRGREVSIEHIVPKALGGPNSLDNLLLACNDCNNERGSEENPCWCTTCTNAVNIYSKELVCG